MVLRNIIPHILEMGASTRTVADWIAQATLEWFRGTMELNLELRHPLPTLLSIFSSILLLEVGIVPGSCSRELFRGAGSRHRGTAGACSLDLRTVGPGHEGRLVRLEAALNAPTLELLDGLVREQVRHHIGGRLPGRAEDLLYGELLGLLKTSLVALVRSAMRDTGRYWASSSNAHGALRKEFVEHNEIQNPGAAGRNARVALGRNDGAAGAPNHIQIQVADEVVATVIHDNQFIGCSHNHS